ncbi:putative nitroreductase TM1586 domain-containing protein [Entamoeba marina]
MSINSSTLPNEEIVKLDNVVMQRVSVRTYGSTYPTEEQCSKIDEFIEQLNEITEPFNEKVRLCLMREDMSALKTFGFITGCKYWIYGVIPKNNINALRQYGYLFEHLILKCEELGLATVWLGGSFTTGSFTKIQYNSEEEFIPCVSPVGINGKGQELLSKVFGGRKRKPWSNFFFLKDKQTLLTEDHLKNTSFTTELFEHLRWAPTAGNSQKVRVIIDGNHLHLFMDSDYFLDVDSGIYVAHAEIFFKSHSLNFERVYFDQAETICKNNGWTHLFSYKFN